MKKISLPTIISLKSSEGDEKRPSPREQLSNQIANIFEMQRQAHQVSSVVKRTSCQSDNSFTVYYVMTCDLFVQLKEDVAKLVASNYPGGVVTTKLASFTSPHFSKVGTVGCTLVVPCTHTHTHTHTAGP